jgi:hypothetical protein
MENTDDTLDYEQLAENHGRAYVEALLDPHDPDPALVEYLNETDISLTNEDLGLNANGERDDD